jgi:hypothetical protein
LEACDSPQRRRDAEGSAELMPRRVPVVECAGKPEKNAPTNGGMAALEGYSNGASTKNQRVGDGFLGRRHHIETEEEKAEGAERLVGGWVANWWIVRQVRGIQPQGA